MNKSLMQIIKDELGGNIVESGFCRSVVKSEISKKVLLKTIMKTKPILRPIYRLLHHALVSMVCRLREDYQGIIYVDPLEIKSTVNRMDPTLKRNDMWHFGKVEGGNWDLGGVPIREYGHVYTILKERVEEGKDYAEIPEFIENVELIYEGEAPDNCRTEKEYREKWHRIEAVYNLLKANGYKCQTDLKTGYPFNEIRVQVGRTGDLLFEEGMHRLVISQLLGLKKIPVIVTKRHAEWVRKNKQRVYKNASQ
jgi:hypothetical protein